MGIRGASGVYTYVENPELNVLDAAIDRIRDAFKQFDTVIVSTSGGKDSTVLFHLALQVAQERNEILHVAHVDEEIVDPQTLAYLERLRTTPNVNFVWACVPIEHTLRSQFRTHWYTWDDDYLEVWARDKPEWSIKEFPDYPKHGKKHAHVINRLFPEKDYGIRCNLVGIRIEESPNRRRAIRMTGSVYGYSDQYNHPAYLIGKPLYDWKTDDIWRAIAQFGWDYSKVYDDLHRAGKTALRYQRVSSWGNASGFRDMAIYRDLYPDTFRAAARRLPEILDMASLGHTKLYRKSLDRPPGLTWQEWFYIIVEQIRDPETKAYISKQANQVLARWRARSTLPYPEEDVPGLKQDSWKYLCYMAAKQDKREAR